MDRFDALMETLRAQCPGLELRENEPMSAHTTFRVGGPARLMALPATPGQAADLLGICRDRGITPFFMGNGSNLLVSDNGYDGLVISALRLDHLSRRENTVCAGSGVSLPKLAAFAAQEGLTGLEFASGIPGSVGGAVYMNAGAYGGEMAQVVECVNYCDGEGPGSFKVMEGKLFRMFAVPNGKKNSSDVRYQEEENSGFSYRHSYFCDHHLLVTQVFFQLCPGDPAAIKSRMAELNARRREKQPLEYPSAGSTFKRPAPVDGQPQYAAALIDRCGLKGLTVGGAQVSEKHAGFVINRGSATAADILALAEQVKDRVLDQTGVELELEIRTLGM